MAMNLAESIQQKLNVEELQKINPDTGNEINTGKPANKFYQLAIPAVLTGLYNFTRLDEKNHDILNTNSENFLSLIFGEKKDTVVSKIADLSGTSISETNDNLQKIGIATTSTLQENLPERPLDKDVKELLTGQRHNILLYLDPALQMGNFIKDDTVDDSTNKMEGPVSNLMHNIGQIFSESGNDKKDEI